MTFQIRPLILVVDSSWSFAKLLTTNAVCLYVRIKMGVSLVVDFDPVTADMAPGTVLHPYHVLSALCSCARLGRWLEIEIQLSRLARLGLCVHDRCLNRTIHKQRHPITARLQSL